jgi:hypothetical protein
MSKFIIDFEYLTSWYKLIGASTSSYFSGARTLLIVGIELYIEFEFYVS